jgi:hypothetical protein
VVAVLELLVEGIDCYYFFRSLLDRQLEGPSDEVRFAFVVDLIVLSDFLAA